MVEKIAGISSKEIQTYALLWFKIQYMELCYDMQLSVSGLD
jgi:hypothetical protein